AEPALHEGVLHEHLAGHIAEQAAAEPDDPGETVHEMGEQAGPPDDDGEREPDAEHDEHEVAVRRRGDRQHVVEAHRHVGDDDDPDRLPEGSAVPGAAVAAGDDEDRKSTRLNSSHVSISYAVFCLKKKKKKKSISTKENKNNSNKMRESYNRRHKCSTTNTLGSTSPAIAQKGTLCEKKYT